MQARPRAQAIGSAYQGRVAALSQATAELAADLARSLARLAAEPRGR